MATVFISYRRAETAGEARALFTNLVAHLGERSVFMDVDNIALGRDFRQVLHERLTSCDLMLALIGKDWVSSTDRSGQRRLENTADYMRLEIEAALQRNIPVTPVLLQGAQMPPAEQLPESIRDFAYRNAFELSHTRWESDVHEMVRRLGIIGSQGDRATANRTATDFGSAAVQRPPKKPWLAIAVASVVAILIAGGALGYYRSKSTAPIQMRTEPARGDGAKAKDSNDRGESPPKVETPAGSEWMTSTQYQQEFNQRMHAGFYPHKVEGRCQGNGEQFRAEWKSIPLGASFSSHHGITKEFYDNKDQQYSSTGYSLTSLTNFRDCSGVDRYQATWLKK